MLSRTIIPRLILLRTGFNLVEGGGGGGRIPPKYSSLLPKNFKDYLKKKGYHFRCDFTS